MLRPKLFAEISFLLIFLQVCLFGFEELEVEGKVFQNRTGLVRQPMPLLLKNTKRKIIYILWIVQRKRFRCIFAPDSGKIRKGLQKISLTKTINLS